MPESSGVPAAGDSAHPVVPAPDRGGIAKYKIVTYRARPGVYLVEGAVTERAVIYVDGYGSELDDGQIRAGVRAFMATLGWSEA